MKLNEKTLDIIEKILFKGNTVELKKINGKVQVIEIARRKQAEDNFTK